MIHQIFFLIGAGGISKVFHMFLNQSCFSQKTKATPKDRQCGNTKPVQINRYPAGGQNQDYENQPFGSMPRCCSSLRRIRFIHVASDESPSFLASSSSWERSSCARRIWYWSVFIFPLDIVITSLLVLFCGCNYNVTHFDLQPLNLAKPRSASTHAGLLTTTDNALSR